MSCMSSRAGYGATTVTRKVGSGVLLAAALTGCGMVKMPEAPMTVVQSADGAANQAGQITAPAAAPEAVSVPTADAAASILQRSPQLIRTAELSLTVEDVPAAIAAANAIAREQQGDVLNLQNQTPQSEGSRHTASMQVRVPQAKLDAALAALSKLGTVQRQAIAAEDVSNQLVDDEARLRNLRRAEATVLEIMDRSGSVADVLKVAQELNTIRSSIEQLDAQLGDLQTRVAYATIQLSFEATIAAGSPQRAVSAQLQESWHGATRSIGDVTVDLLQLGIWLMVYSPYLLLIAGAAVLGWRWRRSAGARLEAQEQNQEA